MIPLENFLEKISEWRNEGTLENNLPEFFGDPLSDARGLVEPEIILFKKFSPTLGDIKITDKMSMTGYMALASIYESENHEATPEEIISKNRWNKLDCAFDLFNSQLLYLTSKTVEVFDLKHRGNIANIYYKMKDISKFYVRIPELEEEVPAFRKYMDFITPGGNAV